MEFIQKILRRIKPATPQPAPTQPVFENETDYYKWFFTENAEWNQATPNYDEQIRWEGIKLFIENLHDAHKKNLNILDLGCGRGWLSNLLSQYGNVTGIEPVAPVVEYGKKLFPDLNLISCTSNDLIKKDELNKYDLIVSSEVIEHVPDNEKDDFVKNIFLLLNNNGSTIISTPRKEVVKQYSKFMKPSQPIEDWMTEKEVEDLFTKNGFEKRDMRRLEKTYKDSEEPLKIYQLYLFKKI